MKNLIKAGQTNSPHSRQHSLLFLTLMLWATAPASADVAQTPLFLTTTVKPNIMLMVDNSQSMKDVFLVVGPGSTYDPKQTYPVGANCGITASTTLPNTDAFTSSTCSSAGGTWSSNSKTCTITTTIPNKTQQTCIAPATWSNSKCTTKTTPPLILHTYDTAIPTNFTGNSTTATSCFSSTTAYKTSGLSIPVDVTSIAQIANWLNWYYSNQISMKATTSKTRLDIVKSASKSLIDYLTPNVRVGLSMFNSGSGGTLYEVIDDLVADKKTNIKNRIDAINSSGGISLTSTPLAGTMVNIGRYFATGNTGNLTLHPDLTPSTAAVSDVFPAKFTDSTTWTGRKKITNEPTFTSNPIQYSCQKSFNVVVTDGLPSSDRSVSGNKYLEDYDGDCPTGNTTCNNFDMKKGFRYPGGNGDPNTDVIPANSGGSNSSDYFDDVTQAMYEMDLRPDLRNKEESKNAKNNVTTFVVGLADDAINPTILGVNTLPKDAAHQGGGKFYFAGSEEELTSSLISAFNFIAEQTSSSSSVATNSRQFQTNTLIYQARFDSSDWSGQLLGIKLISEDINGNGVLDPGEDLNNNGKIDAGLIGPTLWDAATLIPAPVDRHIYSYDPQASSSKGIEFLWPSLNLTQKSVLDNPNSGATSSPILDYLRGDQSKEIIPGKAPDPKLIYRTRSNPLGDMINSDPLFVGTEDLGYGTLTGTEGTDYTAFRASAAYTSRRPMIYVGANDGMLHGFDSSSGIDGGTEIFAYVPNAVISKELATLTDPNYVHHYFVDGSAQSGDAYFSNNTWHTVLVGSMGAGITTEDTGTGTGALALPTGTGGRGLFALDITNPDDFATPSTGASKVLWEFSTRDDNDLGYTLPQPGIVRMMANGQWAAIIANGYNSANGKAVLFIVNVETGVIIKKIEAEITSKANGLSSPVAADVDNDKIVDYIYAGDLQGNLWKFDVSSSDTSKWDVAYNKLPVFTATDKASPSARQPITSKPAIGKATATGQSSGVMIYFGTGKYFEVGDNVIPTSPQVQSFYAIWDVCDKSSLVTCDGQVFGRSTLQEQQIVFEGSSGTINLANNGTSAGDIRITSQCDVGYGTTAPTTTTAPCTNGINRKGWFLDLIPPTGGAQGERAVFTPILRNGRIIFTTLIPIDVACTPGGTGWLMELDQNSGARLSGTPFDINNDGIVDDKDLVLLSTTAVAASGVKSTVGIIKTPAIVECETGLDCKYLSGSSGNLMAVKESVPCVGAGCGVPPVVGVGKRLSWRQLR